MSVKIATIMITTRTRTKRTRTTAVPLILGQTTRTECVNG